MENLSELTEETIVNPVQHVPGQLNPADIPTRDATTPDEVSDNSVWQQHYIFLPWKRERKRRGREGERGRGERGARRASSGGGEV